MGKSVITSFDPSISLSLIIFLSGMSSSLLSSSLVTTGMKAPDSPPRKRKTIRGKSAEIIEKKKPRDQDDKKSSLSSSLLSGVQTKSSMLQSSLLGKSGSSLTTGSGSSYTAGSYSTGSSLLGNTGSTGSFGSSLQSKFGGKTSASLHSEASGAQKTSMTLTSGLLSAGSKKSSLTAFSTGKGKPTESKTMSLSASLLQPSLGMSSLSSSSKLLGSGLSSSLLSSTPQSHVAMGTGLIGGLSVSSGLMGSRQESVESKKEAKIKKEKVTKSRKRARLGGYETSAPVYNLATEIKDEAEIEILKFVPPEKDPSLVLTGARLHDVNGMKVRAILIDPDLRNIQFLISP